MKLNIDPKTQRVLWLEGRRQGIGSSDAPAIVLPYASRPKYMSPWAVWDSKVNGREEESESLFMNFGNVFEGAVGQHVASQRNLELDGSDHCKLIEGGWYKSDVEPWMMASPDFWLEFGNHEPEGVECKVIQNSINAADWLPGSAPPHVTIQAHWCMAVTGAKRWHINALLWFSQEFRMYTVEHDPVMSAKMIAKARQWYEAHVTNGVEPAHDHTPACNEYIQRKYGEHDAIIRTANDVEAALLLEYRQARADADAAKAEKGRLENLLKSLTSGNRGIESKAGGRFLWSQRKGKTSFNAKQFKVDHPDMFDKYIKRGADFRAISFSKPKV